MMHCLKTGQVGKLVVQFKGPRPGKSMVVDSNPRPEENKSTEGRLISWLSQAKRKSPFFCLCALVLPQRVE
jgi:hypothetical protein